MLPSPASSCSYQPTAPQQFAMNQEVWLRAAADRPNMRVIITDVTTNRWGEWKYQVKDKDGQEVDGGRWFHEGVLG